jgi:hypothetical protein
MRPFVAAEPSKASLPSPNHLLAKPRNERDSRPPGVPIKAICNEFFSLDAVWLGRTQLSDCCGDAL